MFASITAVLSALKNYKKIALVAVLAVIIIGFSIQQGKICYYKNQIAKLEAQINTANVAQCNEIICQLKDHIVRVQYINQDTDKITGNISNLKKGKAHEKDYYDIAGRVADRFNNGLQQ
jgi:ABC-type antimicrobial peptide transport system permease subunit